MSWKTRLSLLLVCCSLFNAPEQTRGQESSDAVRQQQIADRFMQVLLRRPRPGTALDRVYGHHIQAGTLDDLVDRLESESNDDRSGAKSMLLGLIHMQRGRDADAVAALKRAEPLLADDAMVSYYLGKALLLVGQADQAAEALERSIERGPVRNEALPVFTELGRIYQRGGQNEKALDVWNGLEKMFPGDTRVGEQIARALAEEGQTEAALQRYEKLAQQSTTSSDFRSVGYQIAAAELKRRLGNHDDATSDLERILDRLRPGSWLHSDVRRRIEAGFLRSGDYTALAEYYAQQAKDNPDDVDTQLRFGRTLAKAGRLVEAGETLQAVAKRAPENVDVRLALVDVYKVSGKVDEAAKQLEKLSQLDPENPDYLMQWGGLLIEGDGGDKDTRHAAAAKVWQQLAEVRQDDPVIIAQVADRLRGIERAEDAIQLYRKAIELAPDQPQYREYLGEYFHRLGRKDDALATWESLAQDDRRDRDSLIRLGEVLTTFGFAEQALDTFAQAAEMDPTFAQRLRYAELLSRAEKFDDALAQLDLAREIVETPEEREQVLRDRIGVYAESGKLDERIEQARQQIAEGDDSVASYRSLALMLDAASRNSEAVEAIVQAIEKMPKDASVLSVAAELYRKGSRYADAVAIYRRLAEIDSRFLSNYLQRIAGLEMQLGQVEQALATGRELIAAQSGNPEPYRFYADLCFRSGRDEEGIETLRRALRAAPRDQESRGALAQALADRFHTDEAIELYWQSAETTDDIGDLKVIVTRLAPLYERKGDFSRLVSRLEQHGRETSDTRSATLLISESQRAISDLGAARQTLEPLLAENPRDTELLQQVVLLSSQADDFETALQYQKQLVALADTPEHRRSMLMLMIQSGQLDEAEAALSRLEGTTDPATMVSMIDRLINQQEHKTAVRMCRAALQKNSDLWEVQTRLAALLVMEQQYDEAIELADTIRSLPISDETRPVSKPAVPRRAMPGSNPTASQTPRFQSSQQTYYFASLFQLGRYANQSYSQRQSSVLSVTSFGKARFAALAIRLAAAAKQGNLDDVIKSMTDQAALEKSTDAEQWWQAYEALAIATMYGPEPTSSTTNSPSANQLQEIGWHLVELDPQEASYFVWMQLAARGQQRSRSAYSGQTAQPPEPLPDDQLDKLVSYVLSQQDGASAPSNYLSYYHRYSRAWLYEELVAAGREAQANEIESSIPTKVESVSDASLALQFFVQRKDSEKINLILEQIRSQLTEWADLADKSKLSELLQLAAAAPSVTNTESYRGTIELMIAGEVLSQESNRYRRNTSTAALGTVSAHVALSSGAYASHEIQIPFSSQLMSSNFSQRFYQAFKFNEDTPGRKIAIKHLQKDSVVFEDHPDRASAERKLRGVLSAFSMWWIGDMDAAYRLIANMSEAFPNDNDLRIERARLAAELKRPREALAALDAINPLDQSVLRTREMAAMNLASQLGEINRVKEAATRLFGMRLDQSMSLALSDQLGRLGMREMAAAVLQRTQRRGGQSPQQILEIANSYQRIGENQAAAEAAFTALRKLNTSSSSNNSYYQRQAVTLLTKAGRLDGLLKQAEQRVKSSPKSMRLRTELAELYTAAGRKDDADRVLQVIAEQRPNDPQTLLATAKKLSSAGKHSEAVDMYLSAFEKHPERIRNDYYEFERAVISAKRIDHAYDAFLAWDLTRLDEYTLGRLANLYRRSNAKPSPSVSKFIRNLLSEGSPNSIAEVMRNMRDMKDFAEGGEVSDVVRRIFASEEVYDPNARFWTAISRSSGGLPNGAFERCLDVIDADEELRADVVALLQTRLDEEPFHPVAAPVLATVNLSTAKRNETVKTIRKLLKQKEMKTHYYLWWQIGQLVSEKKNLKSLAVSIFEHVQKHETSNTSGSSYQYGIGARLADAYSDAGLSEKAREQLLIGYRETDHSRDNQYNPGYGDYQEIRSFLEIGDKLVSVDAPLEAVQIYIKTLSEPEKFARAKRYTGRTNYQDRFRKALDAAISSMAPEHYQKYLKSLIDDESRPDDPTKPRVNLSAIAATEKIDPDQSSIAVMVAATLAKTDAGRKQLMVAYDQLATLSETVPTDWSVAAMQAIISVASKHDAARDDLTKVVALVPSADGENSDTATKGTSTSDILSLYSLAIFALQSDQSDVLSAATRLTEKIASLAQEREQRDIARVLTLAKLNTASATSDPAQLASSLMDMLDATAAPSDPPKVVTQAVADECIKIGESALESGASKVAIEAIKRALGGGPPLRVLQQTGAGSNAFIISQRSTSSSSSDDLSAAAKLESLVQRVNKLVAKLAEKDDTEALLYQALGTVVMPESRKNEVFPHLIRIVGNGATSIDSDGRYHCESISRKLAELATDLGKTTELRNQLDERLKLSGDALAIALIKTQIAVASRDSAEIEQALRTFAKTVGIPFGNSANQVAATSDLDSNAVEAANLLLHAVEPTDVISSLSITDAIEQQLLQMATRDKTLAEHDDLWRRISHRIIESENTDEKTCRRVAENFLDSVRLHYSNYSGSYGADRARMERKNLGNVAVKAGRWALAGEMFTGSGEQLDGLKNHSQPQSLVPFAIQLSDAPIEQQYQLLTKIVFGDDSDSELTDWTSYILYAVPPPELQSVVPRLKKIHDLPIPHPDFSVLSASLLLCHAAAECGKTDELVQRLKPLVKEPGDSVDAMIGLALLTSGDRGAAAKFLPRIRTHLTENAPKLNSTKPIPYTSGFFAARCLSIPDLRELAVKALEKFDIHVRRSRLAYSVTFFASGLALNGGNLAAGATAESPLDHFVAAQLPFRGRPESVSSEFLSMRNNGSVTSVSGADKNILMLKFPVTGDFSFSSRNIQRRAGTFSVAYDGIMYANTAKDMTITTRGQISRGVAAFPHNGYDKAKDLMLGLIGKKGQVTATINGEEVVTDEPTNGMPFLGLVKRGTAICEVTDIKLTGNPVIPRQVNMIDEQMRGWSMQIYGGVLPAFELPIPPSDDVAVIQKQRQDIAARRRELCTWFVENDELLTGDRDAIGAEGEMKHVQYLRPLCDGESIKYEFFYKPEKFEVHPTVGRTALLVRDEGVKLRWLKVEGSQESNDIDPLNEISPVHVLADADDYALIAQDWNKVTLTAVENGVRITVNGKQICRVETSPNEKFGILAEKDRKARIRNMRLTGPWPEKIPDDLMAAKHGNK